MVLEAHLAVPSLLRIELPFYSPSFHKDLLFWAVELSVLEQNPVNLTFVRDFCRLLHLNFEAPLIGPAKASLQTSFTPY